MHELIRYTARYIPKNGESSKFIDTMDMDLFYDNVGLLQRRLKEGDVIHGNQHFYELKTAIPFLLEPCLKTNVHIYLVTTKTERYWTFETDDYSTAEAHAADAFVDRLNQKLEPIL